jgi:hypothetical protein
MVSAHEAKRVMLPTIGRVAPPNSVDYDQQHGHILSMSERTQADMP